MPGDEFLELAKRHSLAEIGHLENRMEGNPVIIVR
jgi:hypothetical protein